MLSLSQHTREHNGRDVADVFHIDLFPSFFALGAIRGHFGGFIPIWTGTAFVGPASASLALSGWWLATAKALLASCHSAQPQLWPFLDSGPLFNFSGRLLRSIVKFRRASGGGLAVLNSCLAPGIASGGLGPLVNQSVINSWLESPARFCLLRSCHADSTRIKSTPTNAFLCRCTASRGAVTSYPTSFCSPCRHRPSLTGLAFLRRRLEAVVILCCILPVLFLRAFIARSVASACSILACVSHHFRCE